MECVWRGLRWIMVASGVWMTMDPPPRAVMVVAVGMLLEMMAWAWMMMVEVPWSRGWRGTLAVRIPPLTGVLVGRWRSVTHMRAAGG
jgi:hypothetical protein